MVWKNSVILIFLKISQNKKKRYDNSMSGNDGREEVTLKTCYKRDMRPTANANFSESVDVKKVQVGNNDAISKTFPLYKPNCGKN